MCRAKIKKTNKSKMYFCCVLYSLFITESPKLLRRTDNTVKVLLGEVVHRIKGLQEVKLFLDPQKSGLALNDARMRKT